MNVLVSVDALFYRTRDGEVWSKTIYSYLFWKRYLDVFENVHIIARVKDAEYNEVREFLKCSGDNVTFIALPFVQGTKDPLKYIFSIPMSFFIGRKASREVNCAIVRLPSIYGFAVLSAFKLRRKPFAIEIVVNPQNLQVMNFIMRKIVTYLLKRNALLANGVSYVTKESLQKDFPSRARKYGESDRYFEAYYSSIDLMDSYFSESRDYMDHADAYSLIHTSNQMNDYTKGQKTVIKTVKLLADRGHDVYVTFLGDGILKEEYKQYANQLGISDRVVFAGLLSSPDKVRNELLKSDIFIFPTLGEGLPRSVIEAMAVGLPCLASPVDGIPELLESPYLIAPDDAEGYARKIEELLNSPQKLNLMSKKNINKAKEYRYDILSERRKSFYTKLRKISR